MVSGALKSVKVRLKLTEGTQTISKCSGKASSDQLYALGSAVGKFLANGVTNTYVVKETTLIQE